MPVCIYCGESFGDGEGEEKHAGECPVMNRDFSEDTKNTEQANQPDSGE